MSADMDVTPLLRKSNCVTGKPRRSTHGSCAPI